MKKLLTFTLALILLLNLTLITDSTVYAKGKRFHDLKTTDWFYETVDILTSQGLISGYPDGTFRPNDSILVSEFITLVVRIKDKSVKNGTLVWYKPYVDRAKELGLVVDGEYDTYERNITRGEMARIIYRALSSEDQVSSDKDLDLYKGQIKDFNSIPLTLKTYILKSYATGIMAGYPDGTFKPQNDANRAEAATMIRRLIDKNFRKIPVLKKQHPTDKFVGLDGKELTTKDGKPLNVTVKEVIEPYYQVLDILKKDGGYIKIGNNYDSVSIFYYPDKDTYITQYLMKFSFYYNPEDREYNATKEYPNYIYVKIFNDRTKQILKDVLKIYYPTKYQEVYNYMLDIQYNHTSDYWKKEGKIENRKYFIRKEGAAGTSISIGLIEK